MILNFIPVNTETVEGLRIELCPDDQGWRWALRQDKYVIKCISKVYHEEREGAYQEALDWCNENYDVSFK